MTITFTDHFCGAGGSSIGLTEAGMELRLAANHWDTAIESHAANFPSADHLMADLSGYDMRRMPRTDVLWSSPECTWHSPAGGRKRVRAELDLFDDYVPDAAGDRSRMTMFDVIRAAEAREYKVILVENVVEVTAWPLFDTWLSAFDVLGYDHQVVCVSSAHVGGPSNPHAPQWRDRIYFVFYQRGIRMPLIQPRPTAYCSQCDADVEAVQSWKQNAPRRIGKYDQQYFYVCGAGRHTNHRVEPYILPAAAAIDWSNLGTRLGDRDRPLAAATMRRIEAGIRMFAHPQETPPFMATINHGADGGGRFYLPQERPLPTRSTKTGDGIVVPPFITELWGTSTARAVADPLAAVTAGGGHHGVTIPDGAFIQKNHGGLDYAAIGHMLKDPREPLPAVVARTNLSLVIPYRRNGRGYPATARPLHTQSTVESAGIAQLGIDMDDVRFRMLGPREALRAQRFPDTYIVKGNKSEQQMQAGNAVSSNVAHWLGALTVEALAA